MLEVKLVGADTCRRYKLMRQLVLEEAQHAGVTIHLIEETEVEGIMKYQTVNLPLLIIGTEKVAQGNPPSRAHVQKYLKQI